jgi:hypothetical protein
MPLRSQELASAIPQATRPLLRQIEGLQSTMKARQETWDSIERCARAGSVPSAPTTPLTCTDLAGTSRVQRGTPRRRYSGCRPNAMHLRPPARGAAAAYALGVLRLLT